MYRTETDTILDATFGALAARAARYPVIARSIQPRTIRKGGVPEPAVSDPGIRWLLLNTLATNNV